METEDKTINPTRFLANFVKCEFTAELIQKLLSSKVAKLGVEHNLYPISKFNFKMKIPLGQNIPKYESPPRITEIRLNILEKI